MAKVTAWLMTAIGVIMVLGLIGIGFDWSSSVFQWVLALIVLAIGITKLVRSYNYKKRR